ncbi:MAG: hypothetical protein M3150_02715 [Pseudomonadota bacterium]|nr:hypothetical protein [Pseudomonadota bacterium]
MLCHRRPLRCLTGFFVVLALLFSQLALANYVCPRQPDRAVVSATTTVGEPCQGMDDTQPVLCHQHAAGSTQALDQLKVVAPTLPLLSQLLFLPPPDLSSCALPLPVSGKPEVRPAPDPLFLSTLRLRV